MKRLENLFRLLLTTTFAVCAVGALSNDDLPMTALFLVLAGLFAWRTHKSR